MTQLEATRHTDLVGFPPDLTAPLRPAVPRRSGQLPLDMLELRSDPTDARRCSTLSSPLSSPLGSPMIEVDDDLEELEEIDDEIDDFGDDDDDDDVASSDRGAMYGPGLYAPGLADSTSPRAEVALGSATLGERARRLGMRFAHKVLVPVAAIAILVIAMGGTWSFAGATPTTFAATHAAAAGSGSAAHGGDEPVAVHSKSGHHELAGKINLNTATEDQLMVLPSVGPAKAERIVTWRKKNGAFKRTADLRRVKGFGYKTFKKLEPYLDIKGDTTLAPK